MKPVKYSVSRKCFHRLSARQRRRIALEVKDTLRSNLSQDSVTPKQPDNAVSYIHVADSFRTDEVPFIANDDISNITYTGNIDNDILSIINNNGSDSEGSTSSSLSISSIDETFQDRLATCFVNNLTHVQGNNILSVLRTHTCFSSLPKD